MAADEFAGAVEAGKVDAQELIESIDLDELRLSENKKYQHIVNDCQELHRDLLTFEYEGKIGNYQENPTLIGDYLGKLRLNANQLFAFKNIYIDILSDLQREYAKHRESLYKAQLQSGKSASAAEKHAREMTRVEETNLKVIENNITIIQNEYERYNGICMYLQSRMKEHQSERFMG